tara:strand:+ start:211 stop:1146 length:936 start_codon:yes stop_codon:yes gene_type:complete
VIGDNVKYSVVQLMHPGIEYPDLDEKGNLKYSKPGIEWSHDKKSGTRLWNNREHKRKFMRMNGVKYLDAKKRPNKGEVTFWGEWEAQSSFDVISKTNKNLDKPRLCHKPFYDSSYSGKKTNGTDPFIFGDHFWFTHCKQKVNHKIRDLGEDSIIIFGSARVPGKMFLVDTIFVVKKRFSQKEIRENIEEYDDLLRKNNLELKDLVRDKTKSEYGFYQGKSYEKNEIFSFVPAKTIDEKSIGHGRLELDRTKEKYYLNKRGSRQICSIVKTFDNKNDLKNYWDLLVDETINSGFVLAYDFPMPEIRESSKHG